MNSYYVTKKKHKIDHRKTHNNYSRVEHAYLSVPDKLRALSRIFEIHWLSADTIVVPLLLTDVLSRYLVIF